MQQVQFQRSLDRDSQNSQSGAAQAERIACARWLLADAENTGERVQLVRHRHRDARSRQRQLIAGETRPVLFFAARPRLRRASPSSSRVVATHQALQLGELAQPWPSADRIYTAALRVRPWLASEPISSAMRDCECCDARALCRTASRACSGNVTALEGFTTRVETLLAIRFPEECGIRQPRAHYPFVAVANLVRIAAFYVRDRDERIQQRGRPRRAPENTAGDPASSQSGLRAAMPGSARRNARPAALAIRPAQRLHPAARLRLLRSPPSPSARLRYAFADRARDARFASTITWPLSRKMSTYFAGLEIAIS